mmetsp:Transcript_17779/g.47962  ORF Transcript_17779/g.47962 Transcript_17779/m.47962 type:complete len:213 (-) Transcript_17779:2709-3347(-)
MLRLASDLAHAPHELGRDLFTSLVTGVLRPLCKSPRRELRCRVCGRKNLLLGLFHAAQHFPLEHVVFPAGDALLRRLQSCCHLVQACLEFLKLSCGGFCYGRRESFGCGFLGLQEGARVAHHLVRGLGHGIQICQGRARGLHGEVLFASQEWSLGFNCPLHGLLCLLEMRLCLREHALHNDLLRACPHQALRALELFVELFYSRFQLLGRRL